MNGYADDLSAIIEALDLRNATFDRPLRQEGERSRDISVVMDRSVSPK